MLQRGCQFRLGSAQSGRNTQYDPANESRSESKHRGAPVHAQVRPARRVDGLAQLCVQHIQNISQAEAQQAAKQRQQHSLGHQLASEAETAGADRQPDGELLAPVCAARHQHGAQIHARNDNHDAHQHAKETFQRSPELLRNGHAGSGWQQRNPPSLVVLWRGRRIVHIKPARGSIERRFRLGKRDARREERQR